MGEIPLHLDEEEYRLLAGLCRTTDRTARPEQRTAQLVAMLRSDPTLMRTIARTVIGAFERHAASDEAKAPVPVHN